jgi:benzoyl-CoA reductase/2-hydroxyglutaryl-CoA dehydratase subunit BcrC/BadD/HgdB
MPQENRPETLAQATWEKLDNHLQNRTFEVAKAKKSGAKVVGVFPGDWVPEELIHACKAIPLGLIQGGEPDPLDIAHTMLPRFICAFVRAACGYRKTGERLQYKIPDMFVVPVSCQSMRRIGDIYSYYLGADVIKLGVPHMPQRDDHVSHFRDNIGDLAAKLEKITGNKPGNLRGSIELYNRIRNSLKALSLMRKAPNPPITTKEFIKLNHASLIGDPVFIAEILETLVQDLKDKEGKGIGPRLMIVGPCIAQGDWKVIDLVEELGGRIVIEEVVEGMRYYRREIKTEGDLIYNLAEGYLRDRNPWPFVVGVIQERSDRIFETAKEFGAQGIIWYQLKYCECYDFESHYNAEQAEKRGIPFIKLSSEYEQIDKGTVRTRIETFLETISN